jgi:hypothetical protein
MEYLGFLIAGTGSTMHEEPESLLINRHFSASNIRSQSMTTYRMFLYTASTNAIAMCREVSLSL